jgi:hypothetical protein
MCATLSQKRHQTPGANVVHYVRPADTNRFLEDSNLVLRSDPRATINFLYPLPYARRRGLPLDRLVGWFLLHSSRDGCSHGVSIIQQRDRFSQLLQWHPKAVGVVYQLTRLMADKLLNPVPGDPVLNKLGDEVCPQPMQHDIGRQLQCLLCLKYENRLTKRSPRLPS